MNEKIVVDVRRRHRDGRDSGDDSFGVDHDHAERPERGLSGDALVSSVEEVHVRPNDRKRPQGKRNCVQARDKVQRRAGEGVDPNGQTDPDSRSPLGPRSKHRAITYHRIFLAGKE